MDLALQNRHALVTGASRGIGRAIAVALAAEGANVVAVARNRERLNELAALTSVEQTAGDGDSGHPGRGTITAHACDLADASAIDALGSALSQVDILVINTGGPPPGAAADTPDAVWSQQFEAMFMSAVRLTRLALPGMRQRGFGRILAVVSSGVIPPIPNLGVSNALRAAVVGWAKTLAGEVAAAGITVNCIAPGRIATDRVAELDQGRAKREGIAIDEVEKQSRAVIPAGRYGEAEEFASVVAFLASPRASYMTGGVIRVDGGMIRSV
ncbi:MAG TPA: SDR family oxidoreductase [Steroidobacteraceae bacterium]